MKRTRVSLNGGGRTTLCTDDTLTLAWPGMHETTAGELEEFVSRRSLLRIAIGSTDSNERRKASMAYSRACEEAAQ